MRVTFLTHYFPPEVGAPQARIRALAERLSAARVEVTVHTCPPHYPDGRIQATHRNRPFSRERVAGVRVVRSAVYPAANAGVVRRLADHASFAASAVATAPLAPPADVVVAESPPLFLGAAGIAYAASKRAALVVNVADRWPESAVQLGMLHDPRLIALAERLERACYRHAALVTVPTEGLVDELGSIPEAAGKVEQLPPAVDVERFASVPALGPGGGGPLRVLYAGTIGLAQGVATLVEAAGLAGPATVQVTIAGGGAEAAAIERRLAGGSAPNVELLGIVPHERVPTLLGDADAAVVLLRDRPLFERALPTKILEAMAAGRPVVVSARGEAARFVERAGAGIAVAPEDPGALAAALGELAADRGRAASLGAAGRRFAEKRLARPISVERWRAALERAAAARLSRP